MPLLSVAMDRKTNATENKIPVVPFVHYVAKETLWHFISAPRFRQSTVLCQLNVPAGVAYARRTSSDRIIHDSC